MLRAAHERLMRFSCPSCQATFQTASGGKAPLRVVCPGCAGEMDAATEQSGAQVVELRPDRAPTRRYDLHDLRARLEEERAARPSQGPLSARSLPKPGPLEPVEPQVWHVSLQGRRVGPLSHGGLEGLRARGLLTPASLVWRQGWPVWAAAEAVPELRPILGLAGGKPAQGAPAPPSLPEPSEKLPELPGGDLDVTQPLAQELPSGLPSSDDLTDPHALAEPGPPQPRAAVPAAAREPARPVAAAKSPKLPAQPARMKPLARPGRAQPEPEPLELARPDRAQPRPGQSESARPVAPPRPPPADGTPATDLTLLTPLPPRRRTRSASSENMFGALADEPRSPKPVAIGLALLIAALGVGILLFSSNKGPPAPAAAGAGK